jgi:hypothetical protein
LWDCRKMTENLQTVIVELQPYGGHGLGPRPPQVALLKASYLDDVAQVIFEIGRLGGRVAGLAWISRSVRCDVPPGARAQLEGLPIVAAVDDGRPLLSESDE